MLPNTKKTFETVILTSGLTGVCLLDIKLRGLLFENGLKIGLKRMTRAVEILSGEFVV